MVKAAKKTLAELIAALDSSTLTLADILHDLEWAARERERCRLKDTRKRKAMKESKEAATAATLAADVAKAHQDTTTL